MKPFQRIVVAVDFSEVSHAAWRVAGQLGGRDGRLLALNVVVPLPLPNVGYANIPAAQEEPRRENERRLGELRAPKGARVERRAVTGEVVHQVVHPIVETARDASADLVIVGAARDGRGIAEAVVREAPCPVLVVKAAA